VLYSPDESRFFKYHYASWHRNVDVNATELSVNQMFRAPKR
jgi:hypothetical protein